MSDFTTRITLSANGLVLKIIGDELLSAFEPANHGQTSLFRGKDPRKIAFSSFSPRENVLLGEVVIPWQCLKGAF